MGGGGKFSGARPEDHACFDKPDAHGACRPHTADVHDAACGGEVCGPGLGLASSSSSSSSSQK